MEGAPVDPRLLGLVTPDEVFRQEALTFMRVNAPTAHQQHLRSELDQLVSACVNSSRDSGLQELLFHLHTRYNLDGLVDGSFLNRLRENIIFIQTSRGVQFREHARLCKSIGATQQSLEHSQPPPTSATSEAPEVRQYTFINVSRAEAAEINEEDAESWELSNPYHGPARLYRRINWHPVLVQGEASGLNSPSLPSPQPPGATHRCHPPNLNLESLLIDRDPDWEFECDECGHPTRYRSEFVRHFKEQQGFRGGFKIVSTRTGTNPMWYGMDAGDNEYMGPMIFNPKLPGQKRSSRTRLAEPCGPRLRNWRLRSKTGKQRDIDADRYQKSAEDAEDD